MALSKTTKDHDEIKQWAEQRGAVPGEVEATETSGSVGILRFMFPKAPNSNDGALKEISWDDFFEKFDASGLELLYQDVTKEGAESNFNRLIYPENESASVKKSAGKKTAGKSATKTATKSAAAKKTTATSPAKKSATKSSSAKAASTSATKKTTAKKSAVSVTASAKPAAKKPSATKAAAKKLPDKPSAKKAPAKKTVAAKKQAAVAIAKRSR